jgi:hypothetical protein
MSNVFQAIESDRCADAEATMNRLLDDLIQPANYIGEVITLAYEDATVQIHDKHRETVGGIPSQCFVPTQPLASASGYRLLSGHDSSSAFEPRAV